MRMFEKFISNEGKITYTKAIALSKIEHEQKRQQLLEEARTQNLSLREIKQRIEKLKENPIESPSITVKDLMKNINEKKLWETEPKKWQKVEKLLEKVKLLLEEE